MYAFWGKEPITVGGNLLPLRRIIIYVLEGKLFLYALPQLGPFPLEYGGNKTTIPGATAVAKTKEIQLLFTVE